MKCQESGRKIKLQNVNKPLRLFFISICSTSFFMVSLSVFLACSIASSWSTDSPNVVYFVTFVLPLLPDVFEFACDPPVESPANLTYGARWASVIVYCESCQEWKNCEISIQSAKTYFPNFSSFALSFDHVEFVLPLELEQEHEKCIGFSLALLAGAARDTFGWCTCTHYRRFWNNSMLSLSVENCVFAGFWLAEIIESAAEPARRKFQIFWRQYFEFL